MSPRKPVLPPLRPPGPQQIVSGATAMKAARQMQKQQARQDEWPYTHVYPPTTATRIHAEGIIPAPAVSTLTQILAYTVPNGFQAVIVALVQIYSGSGFFIGSTDIQWLLDINTPITAPAGGSPQSYPVQGLSPSNIPKGGMIQGAGIFAPYPLVMPEFLGPLDIMRSKVTTSAPITPGAPNFFISIFEGWMWETTL